MNEWNETRTKKVPVRTIITLFNDAWP